VVSLVGGATAPGAPDEAALIAHTKEHLAGYKCPKRVVLVDEVHRGPNGKPDYKWAAGVATESLGTTADA
jgi:fatty-acyl-CoA synthase